MLKFWPASLEGRARRALRCSGYSDWEIELLPVQRYTRSDFAAPHGLHSIRWSATLLRKGRRNPQSLWQVDSLASVSVRSVYADVQHNHSEPPPVKASPRIRVRRPHRDCRITLRAIPHPESRMMCSSGEDRSWISVRCSFQQPLNSQLSRQPRR